MHIDGGLWGGNVESSLSCCSVWSTIPFGQNAQGRFDPEAHRSDGEFDPSSVRLMRHRVVPPTSNQVRLADDLFEHEEEDVEEAPTGNSIA